MAVVPGRAAPSPWRRVEVGGLALLGAVLCLAALLVLLTPRSFDLPSPTGRILAAAALYAGSHALRLLRLALLVHRPGLPTRRVALIHLYTSALGLLIPFKLNELIRIRELGVACGSWRTGLVAVWLERTLDAAVLAALLLLALLGDPGSAADLAPVLLAVGGFVALTLILAFVAPGNMRGLMLHLVRRPGGERSVQALRFLRGALTTLKDAPALVRGRLPTLVLLSIGVWIAELMTLSVAVSGLDLTLSRLSAATLAVLSGVSFEAPALVSASADGLRDALQRVNSAGAAPAYRAVLVLPLAVAGALAAVRYVPWRARGVAR